MNDVREKIQKLLALSKSSNEFEAQAAMCKARELMVKHKLDEKDFEEKKKVIKTVRLADVTYSTRRDSWMWPLMNIISENYNCKTFNLKDKRTFTVSFMGFEEDVEICEQVFRYALGCIRTGIKNKQERYQPKTAKGKTAISDSYAYGFINGLGTAFDKQNAENEKDWGLVLCVPQAVKDYFNESTCPYKSKCKDKIKLDSGIYSAGQQEGKQFTTRKEIGKENEKIKRNDN